LGVAQMGKVKRILELRRSAASWYHQALPTHEIIPIQDWNQVFQMFPIRTEKRDQVKAHLAANGIDSTEKWFQPVHLTEFYRRDQWQPVSLPVTEKVSKEILCLPMWPGITQAEIEYVCKVVEEAL